LNSVADKVLAFDFHVLLACGRCVIVAVRHSISLIAQLFFEFAYVQAKAFASFGMVLV